jgi:hypothetical protein
MIGVGGCFGVFQSANEAYGTAQVRCRMFVVGQQGDVQVNLVKRERVKRDFGLSGTQSFTS